jgi:hypothetical protein
MKTEIKYVAYLEPLGYYCSDNISTSGFTDNINKAFEYKTYRGAMKRLIGGLNARQNYRIGNLHLSKYADCEYGYIMSVEYQRFGNNMSTKVIKKEKYNFEETDAYLNKTNKGLQKKIKAREELLQRPEYQQNYEKGDPNDEFWN